MKRHSNSYFVTLTYNEKFVPNALDSDNNAVSVVSRRDVQLFFKRLRQNIPNEFRYYCVSEYGPNTLRPHYHFLIFCSCSFEDFQLAVERSWSVKIGDKREPMGFIKIGEITPARLNYVTKYVNLKTKLPKWIKDNYPPFTLMSKNLGDNFLTDEMVDYYCNCSLDSKLKVMVNGRYYSMPRYYRERIYTNVFVHDLIDRFISIGSEKYKYLTDSEILDFAKRKFNSMMLFNEYVQKNLYKNREI